MLVHWERSNQFDAANDGAIFGQSCILAHSKTSGWSSKGIQSFDTCKQEKKSKIAHLRCKQNV
jgi:hypothetical protein